MYQKNFEIYPFEGISEGSRALKTKVRETLSVQLPLNEVEDLIMKDFFFVNLR